MSDIRVLPELLVNQIAAGEVIERPASVVKELLENALDAGASRISLDVVDGGAKLIRVADDGRGIPAEQLPLALRPHATSKLSCESDLFHIHTLGFRGEALASIAAISHLRLLSRTADSPAAAEIHAAGDQFEPVKPAHGPVGTTIEVRDLFFNVPARRKFLRSPATETGHVTEQLARTALPQPGVAFEMTSGSRLHKRLRVASDLRERLSDFFGLALAEGLLPVSQQQGQLRLEGYVAPPADSRASGKWQYLFVNGRYIRDRLVQHAIRETYRGLMEPSRAAVTFLFLTIEPDRFDVNVHPTKIEVRWQNSQAVHAIVRAGLREALGTSDLTPTFSPARAVRDASPARPDVMTFFDRPAQAYGTPARTEWTAPQRPPGPPAAFTTIERAAPSTQDEVAETNAPPVAQLHRTYLVTETPDGIMIIDQHALHERIIYEQLRQRLTTGALESQNLLIPQPVELTAEQKAALQGQPQLLQRLGIAYTDFDPQTLAIQAFPSLLKPAIIPDFIRDLADALDDPAAVPDVEALVHKALDMMACKAAVKAGDPLTPDERRALVEQRHLADKGTNCPHGRPTALRFTLADIERQFKRR